MGHRIFQSPFAARSQAGRRPARPIDALAGLLLALGASESACAQVARTTPSPSPGPAARPAPPPPIDNKTNFSERLLAAHNEPRAKAGQQPLTWSAEAAEQAQAWADKAAARGVMSHAPQPQRFNQGEIVWRGAAGRTAVEDAITDYTDEAKDFVPGTFPDVSRTGQWSDVGNYTQIIWPATRELGCGLATAGGKDYLVCRYQPLGNIRGEPVP